MSGQTRREVGCCPQISQGTSLCDCPAPCPVTSLCPAAGRETCLVWIQCGPPGTDVGCWAPDAGRRGCRGPRLSAWWCALCRWAGLACWDCCRTHRRQQTCHCQEKQLSQDFLLLQQRALLPHLINKHVFKVICSSPFQFCSFFFKLN